MLPLTYWLVDAFTAQPFKGNPAGVCVVDEFEDDAILQNIASELNWSETSFVKRIEGNHFHLRWFSPKDECPLCGHATIATAHILWQQGFVTENTITFETLSGELSATREEDGWITLNFPARPVKPTISPEALRDALGNVNIEAVLSDDLIYVVVLPDVQDVIKAQPNLNLIEMLPVRAVCITARGALPYDFVSRYFAPRVGIPEDPVCGSAHCRLVPYWSDVLGKNNMLAYQASKRGGILKLSLIGDRVYISGQAVTISEGRFSIEQLIFKPKKKVINI